MAIVAREHRGLYASLLASFTLFGISSTLVGAILPALLETFHWSYGVAGVLLAAGSLGSLLSNYAGGKLIGRMGPRATLGTGFGLCLVSLAFFAATPSPALNIALYLLLGLGQGLLEVGVNWAVLRMDAEGRGRPLNVMHGSFSIGAVVGPFVMGVLLSTGVDWALVYRGIAALFAVLFGLVFVLPFGRITPPRREAGAAPASRQGGAVRYIGFVPMLFYVGTELGISNWSAEYFVRSFSWKPAAAAFMVSVFWGGLTLGRLGVPLVFRKARPDRLIVVLSLLFSAGAAALAGLGFAGPAASVLAVLSVAAAGLGASCVYTSAITLVGRAYESDPGPAIGLASTGGATGSLLFPFAMSAIASALGVRAGILFYAALSLGSLASCASLVAATRRRLAAPSLRKESMDR